MILKETVKKTVRDFCFRLTQAGLCYVSLQVHKSVSSSHAVYSMNMERIINRLWHPSEEDLTQEHIHRQETTIKRDIQAQQFVFRT